MCIYIYAQTSPGPERCVLFTAPSREEAKTFGPELGNAITLMLLPMIAIIIDISGSLLLLQLLLVVFLVAFIVIVIAIVIVIVIAIVIVAIVMVLVIVTVIVKVNITQ